MMNNKNGLDEMQRQRRNSIGNQMFMIMFWALFLNIGLYGAGITWLKYPTDVIIIVSACMFVYLVRLIVSGSYLAEKEQKGISWVNRLTMIIMSTVAVVVISLSRISGTNEPWSNAVTIFVTAVAVGSIIALVTLIVKRVRNKDNDDEQ